MLVGEHVQTAVETHGDARRPQRRLEKNIKNDRPRIKIVRLTGRRRRRPERVRNGSTSVADLVRFSSGGRGWAVGGRRKKGVPRVFFFFRFSNTTD